MSFDDPIDDSQPNDDTDTLPADGNQSSFPRGYEAEASDPALTEDGALALLKSPDLSARALDQLSKNGHLMKSRKVRLALVEHFKTPRHISFSTIRHLFTFDLMHVALMPAVPADIKLAAEEGLINRLERLAQGERLTLARRASGRVAAELLLDSEPRVIQAALENSRLTESLVVKALMRDDAPAQLVGAVCHNSKWSVRHDVRVALLHREQTPLDLALQIARSLSSELLQEVLKGSHLSEDSKKELLDMNGKGDDRSGG